MENEQKPKLTIVPNGTDMPSSEGAIPLVNQPSMDPEKVVPIDQNDPDPDPVPQPGELEAAKS
ncbi:MAG: hypothetical protein WCK69_02940 [Candidatus Saccharibacteria bacterium]